MHMTVGVKSDSFSSPEPELPKTLCRHGLLHLYLDRGLRRPAFSYRGPGNERKTEAVGKVLLGWELGDGIGYASRLLAIARQLARSGHEPVVALRNFETTWPLSTDDPFPVIQAPMVMGRLGPARAQSGFNPAGFADLMECNGFGSFDHLMGIVKAWSAVIDVVKPDLIVGAPSRHSAVFRWCWSVMRSACHR